MTDEPFPVKATARSAQHAQLIVDEAERLGVLDAVKHDPRV